MAHKEPYLDKESPLTGEELAVFALSTNRNKMRIIYHMVRKHWVCEEILGDFKTISPD
jgi:hypothetical protein